MTNGAPSRRDVRLAGIGLGVVLAALGVLKLSQHRPSAPVLIAASALALVSAAFAPALLRPLVQAGQFVGVRVVWLVTRAALLLVFYLVVTPIAVIGRLFGASFSDSDFSKRRPSYWVKRDERPRTAEGYDKQY